MNLPAGGSCPHSLTDIHEAGKPEIREGQMPCLQQQGGEGGAPSGFQTAAFLLYLHSQERKINKRQEQKQKNNLVFLKSVLYKGTSPACEAPPQT